MGQTITGGVPLNLNFQVSDTGDRYCLEALSAELIFRVLSGSTRLYWTRLDFEQNRAYITLNGDSFFGEFRLRAAASYIWLRGEAEIEVIVIQRAT